MKRSSVVIHVPHASTEIPEAERKTFLIDLSDELLKMTDHCCDELFCGGYPAVVHRVSRLVCDPERFRDDASEEMAAVGMGAAYTRAHTGEILRILDGESRERILKTYYDPHHDALNRAVRTALEETGRCLIIDGHSFYPVPLPHEPDQQPDRPDFCIGIDSFHTPDRLTGAALSFLRDSGYTVSVNTPFAGAIVPMQYYRKEPRVLSIMIEVNRRLYLNSDGTCNLRFGIVREDIQELIEYLHKLC